MPKSKDGETQPCKTLRKNTFTSIGSLKDWFLSSNKLMNIHLGLQKLLQVVSFHLVGALRRDSGRTTVDRDKKKNRLFMRSRGSICDRELASASIGDLWAGPGFYCCHN